VMGKHQVSYKHALRKICRVSIIELQASMVVCVAHCGLEIAQLHSGLLVFSSMVKTLSTTYLASRMGRTPDQPLALK